LFACVLPYAILGGADFGSGFWDLTAGDNRRGGGLRERIDHSLGPVWEANHVWLIFILVFLWTGFPTAFAAIVTTLSIPLALAATGIVLRGATFAFRKVAPSLSLARGLGAIFAASSVITPFFFGTVVGSVASGRVPPGGYGDRWTSWTSPTSILGGVLAVLTCAYLAGVFLLADASRGGQSRLVESLRHRVLRLGAITGVVVTGGALVLRSDAAALFHNLQRRGFPLVVLSTAAGIASYVTVATGRFERARVATVIAVGSVVAGWGAAQYPWIVNERISIASSAGLRPTLIGLLVVAVLAAAIVLPSLFWLFSLVRDRERSLMQISNDEPSTTA
jgi:cytochrome d ubiquinol oxidase subunit II